LFPEEFVVVKDNSANITDEDFTITPNKDGPKSPIFINVAHEAKN